MTPSSPQAMPLPDPEEAAHLARLTEHTVRVARMARLYGKPGHVSADEALAMAADAGVPVAPDLTAGDVCAFTYLNDAAANAYAESNRVHNGIPTLAQVPLPHGRVLGILDLRPALGLTREEP